MVEKRIRLRKEIYEQLLLRVEKWKIPQKEKKFVKDFFRDYELGKITNRVAERGSLEPYTYYLKRGLEFLNKPSEQLTEKDIDNLSMALLKDKLKSERKAPNGKVIGTPLSEGIKVQIRRILSQYIGWRLGDDLKALKFVKNLKVRTRQKQRTPKFLTEEEVDALYQGCKNAEERFLIAVLFSSGARRGEFYNIRRSDIQLPKGDENFVKLTLREEFSKTKGRTISLYYKNALDAVKEFLDERIKQGIKPEEAVFVKGSSTARKKLARLGKQILDRDIHFHLFRSSCATWISNRLNRNQMCFYFGW
ncbi:hypothetical protein COX97_02060, partial [Candidatus Pacearchaeota archaeon CG_4_10_14_0_2_um_filter_05_32_18]